MWRPLLDSGVVGDKKHSMWSARCASRRRHLPPSSIKRTTLGCSIGISRPSALTGTSLRAACDEPEELRMGPEVARGRRRRRARGTVYGSLEGLARRLIGFTITTVRSIPHSVGAGVAAQFGPNRISSRASHRHRNVFAFFFGVICVGSLRSRSRVR